MCAQTHTHTHTLWMEENTHDDDVPKCIITNDVVRVRGLPIIDIDRTPRILAQLYPPNPAMIDMRQTLIDSIKEGMRQMEIINNSVNVEEEEQSLKAEEATSSELAEIVEKELSLMCEDYNDTPVIVRGEKIL